MSDYQSQLQEKTQALEALLADQGITMPGKGVEVFTSPEKFFRMRAEFKVWHDGDTAHYAMFQKNKPRQPIFLRTFEHASERINQLMPLIIDAVNANTLLKHKLFQIDFLDTTTADTVVTFIYHKKLDDDWVRVIKPLQESLGVQVIGRSRKQKVILHRDYVIERLTVNDKQYYYQQIENSFTQPNARVCEKMLAWAVNKSRDFGGDLLELYCGNGNFTLPLAQNFNRVLATEISKPSVQSAHYNLSQNKLDNVEIIRMSSEEFCQAMDKVRAFTRLKDIDLGAYSFSTVFVDPPRSGLDADTIALIKRFEHIIYISCNPHTFVDNLELLKQTHNIVELAVFDQFPYTEHLEVGAILSKLT